MGNCLVTQLKGIVNNDNLEYLGKGMLHVTIPQGYTFDANKYIAFQFASISDVTIIGDGYFTNPNGDNLGKIKQIGNDVEVCYLSAGTYKILFDKYNLRYLSTSLLLEYITTDIDISYNTVLTYFKIGNSSKAMNVDQFNHLSTLTNIEFHNNVFGNIQNFENKINIVELYVSGSSVEGNVSDLLDALYANGKRTPLSITENGVIIMPEGSQWLTTFDFDDNGWHIRQ